MIKVSKYNIIKKLSSGNYLLFNTFTSSMIIIDKCELDAFQNNYKNISNKKFYLSYGFLTEQDEDKTLNTNKIEMINDKRYAHYTIFTTLMCNANCKYCFEKKDKSIMSIDTAKDILNFIKKESEVTKKIHIQWFGGEPLLNINVIDCISKDIIKFCKHNKIIYSSNIVTNGSLLNEKILRKIINYNVVNLQVTLDGTKDVYEKTKSYNNIKDSYNLVLSNIEKALINNLDVTVRINFDEGNFDDVLKLLDELVYLKKYKKFRINVMPIYKTYNNNNSIDTNNINKYFEILFNKMINLSYIKSEKYFNLNIKPIFCKAYKDNTFVFYPNGQVSKCTHDIINVVKNDDSICINCKFKPLCGGGCLLEESGCSSKCYIYKYAIDAVLNSILTINKINDKIISENNYE